MRFNVYSLNGTSTTLIAGFHMQSDAADYIKTKQTSYGQNSVLILVQGTIEGVWPGQHGKAVDK